MASPRIVLVEWGVLTARRPRHAGSNARLGAHGLDVRLPIVRLSTDDGASGFGACHAPPEQLPALLGVELDALFAAEAGVREPWLPFEYPIWDLVGRRAGQPVYALAAAVTGAAAAPLTAPCYDTSLYFDDLHLDSEGAAAELLAQEAREGFARGHRAFKLKVGRGARHLPLEEGTRRDIAIVRAVRAAIGPEPPIMLDANNGYNLNLAKRVLAETADCGIFWLEEPFHEDNVLYRDLREWLGAQGLPTLIADGEGQADPRLVAWAREGLVDVIQYDIFGYGLTRWLALGRELDAAGVRSAPHHYGGHYGNYAGCHLAGALQRFTFVEWDEAAAEGLDTSGYIINEGRVQVPATPGFGLLLDEARFAHAVAHGGRTHGR
jgi:L-alanine-DL-glutamate epimerase-like enolase superfamily enzyme